MKKTVFLVFIVWMKALVSFTEDDASSFMSCNMKLLTWQEAVGNCTIKGGYMPPFDTGLGQNIEQLHLQSEIDIWTADYLTISNSASKAEEYCAFNYLSSTQHQKQELFYGDCNANRNYFCKNEAGKLGVFNSTREKVHCDYTVSSDDLRKMKSTIKSGYYWSSQRLNGTVSTDGENVLSNPLPGTKEMLCGAYKRSIGMYYANCNGKRFSLCSRNGNIPLISICFDGGQNMKITEHTKIVTKAPATTPANRQETTADKSDTSTKQPMIAQITVKDKSNVNKIHSKKEEKNSDIGKKVGVSLGIILPLACGVLIIIYIYRRRIKCWQSSNSKPENGRMPVHCQLNVYSESIQDTPIPSENIKNENNLTDISAQYAVVKKPKKSDSKSRKDDYSNESYRNGTHDEYDVASRIQNYRSNPSDNLYNHFESADEYNSTSFVRKEGVCDSFYNTTGDHNLVESTYDSTAQVNNTALPDDVYNHFSQDDNFYDSTSITRNK